MPRRPVSRSPQLAWWITGPLALIGVVLAGPAGYYGPRPVFPGLGSCLLFLGLFTAAETINLHFELRRHGFSLSLTEVPLVLGLFYLNPLMIIVLRLAGRTIVQASRKVSGVKLAFNMAATVAATACAGLVVDAGRPLRGLGPVTWLVLLGAVSVSVVVNVTSLLAVLSLVQGRVSTTDIVRVAMPGLLATEVNATVGLIVLLVLQVSPWTVLLLGALAAVLVAVYRAYAQFLLQHKSMSELYELTHALGEVKQDGVLADTLLFRVRALMRAEYATLWLPAQSRYPEVLLSARVEEDGLLDVSVMPQQVRQQAVAEGVTIAVGPRFGDTSLRVELRDLAARDAIVVPLRSGHAVIGSLDVVGRLGEMAHFGPEDVRLLETVAAQTAVAVENTRLLDRLRHDATHDGLTGLPNRRRMLAALDEAVKVRAPGEVVVVLLFDVAGLRDVNDSLGFTAGDKLLAEVARRLRGLSPPAALVGRVGGDEFAVTLRMPDAEAAVALAGELRTRLQDPLVIGTLTMDVVTSVGVAVHPDHGIESATLLQRADVATHAAKSSASGVLLFNSALESRSVRRLGLAGDLRRALDNGELKVYFQPQVALRDRRLSGVECLTRWEHPTHGLVAPEDFIAVAEHTGQLNRLTDFVLAEGLRRARQWADAGRRLSISVNLSPRTLLDADFPDRVVELLDEYGVEPGTLTLDIAEDSVIGETDRPLPTMRRLQAIGVRLAVDDFGTGYASLAYLRRLPVHEVKIDRSFVQGMATDQGDLAIVRAMVDLARHFGLTVVAEGVESELTLSLLTDIGCDIGQGFLFSRPLPPDRLEAWLAAQTETESTPAGEVRRLRAVP